MTDTYGIPESDSPQGAMASADAPEAGATRLDDEALPGEIGAAIEADEADILEQEEVAVTEDMLEDDMDREREEPE